MWGTRPLAPPPLLPLLLLALLLRGAAQAANACPEARAALVSKGGSEAARVTFRNEVPGPITLYWVGFAGGETVMATVQRGHSASQDSFLGHAFRVRLGQRDAAGPLLAEHVVVGDGQVIVGDCHREATPGTGVAELLPLAPTFRPDPAFGDAGSAAWRACELGEWLSAEAWRGYHLICITPAAGGGNARARLTVFKDGMLPTQSGLIMALEPSEQLASLSDLLLVIGHHLGFERLPGQAKAAVYNSDGRRVTDLGTLFQHGTLHLFEGGVWMWPGVRIGYQRDVGNLLDSEAVTRITTLSLTPKIFAIKHFLRDSECSAIIEAARPFVRNAAVANKDADRGKSADEWRISNFHFMSSKGNAGLMAMERRVQDLTRIPITHAEDTQVLRYDPNGFYSAHHDYFDPQDYSNNVNMMQLTDYGNQNRLATVFFYLSNVSEGGHTAFPRSGGLPRPSDFKDCTRGLSVAPEQGKVILFYSMLPNGELDEYSLHGGCKVEQGEKWSANLWIWNKPFNRRQQRGTHHTELATEFLGRQSTPPRRRDEL